MATITKEIVTQAAQDLAGMMEIHYREIDAAYTNIEGNLAVTLKCTFKPAASSGAIAADLAMNFKMDEFKEKMTREYFEQDKKESPGPLFEATEKERARLREILFRDFRPFAASLRVVFRETTNVVLFKTFKLAA